MTKINEQVKWLYTSDEYLAKFPDLFQEDTPWKLTKIIPVLDRWAGELDSEQKEVNVLDVGGGAGLILKGVSSYLEDRYSLSVRKQALDLSPGMLEQQQKNNPDLVRVLNEDIAHTSLADKSVDLTLIIDVLEHVPEPAIALQELKRISNYIVFKVPLEDNLLTRVTNLFNQGQTNQHLAMDLGHVNHYNAKTLRNQIQEHCGILHHLSYTNVFQYEIRRRARKKTGGGRQWLVNQFCSGLHHISPAWAARMHTDFAMLLVRSD